MQDKLIIAMDTEQNIRIHLAYSRDLVAEASRRHHCSATASAALGRLLTAAVIMGHDLKAEQAALTLRLQGNGPGGPLIATADAEGHVRGLITHPEVEVPAQYPGKLNVGALVGNDGFLEVIKDDGAGASFSGKVELVSGEIGEDLANYYLQSEQIPALVSVGVLVNPDLSIASAGGLIAQALPAADDAVLAQVEENILSMGPISSWSQTYERPEEALHRVMQGLSYRVLEWVPISFRCNCSRERLQRILKGLPAEELQHLTDKKGEAIEVICNYCTEAYNFMPEEIGIDEEIRVK